MKVFYKVASLIITFSLFILFSCGNVGNSTTSGEAVSSYEHSTYDGDEVSESKKEKEGSSSSHYAESISRDWKENPGALEVGEDGDDFESFSEEKSSDDDKRTETSTEEQKEEQSEVEEIVFVDSNGNVINLSWEDFSSLSPVLKDKYLESFEDEDAFYQWLLKAQQEYSENHPEETVNEEGNISLK